MGDMTLQSTSKGGRPTSPISEVVGGEFDSHGFVHADDNFDRHLRVGSNPLRHRSERLVAGFAGAQRIEPIEEVMAADVDYPRGLIRASNAAETERSER
jgi:hypothetical protein